MDRSAVMAAASTGRRSSLLPKAIPSRSRSYRSPISRLPAPALSAEQQPRGRAMQQEVAPPTKKPLWRRIVDYPLVAMLIALAIAILCFTVGLLLGRYVVPRIPGF